jgi:hypothetical protein
MCFLQLIYDCLSLKETFETVNDKPDQRLVLQKCYVGSSSNHVVQVSISVNH